MERRAGIFFLSLCAICAAGCATFSPENHAEPVNDARRGRYREALSFIESHERELYPSKSDVVKNLDQGILLHYSGDFDESNKRFSSAEKLMFELYTKSVSKEIGAFIVNDNVLDYSGEDYEDIYANIFMSLNYARQNLLDDAIVETNRAMNKIQSLSTKHDSELLKARAAAEINDGETSIQFHNSALAQYLSLIYHRAIGDDDEAHSCAIRARDAFKTQSAVYDFPLPSSLADELAVPSGKARLNVVAFSGLSPVKREERIDFMGRFFLALPVLERLPNPVKLIVVTATNRGTGEKTEARAQTIESLENIALETFQIRSQVIYAKAVARAITKAVTTEATDIAGRKMSRSDDSATATAGSLLQLFSIFNNISNAATERADLRVSRYFPARADIAGLTLEPGAYDVSVAFCDAGGAPVSSRLFNSVNVSRGGLNLVEAVSLGAR